MSSLAQKLIAPWASENPRLSPFAAASTPGEVPLSRLLRLSLFQVSVGMALVLLVGTLNRVMVLELGVPSALATMMVVLPLLFAPLQVLIGHRSDCHRSSLGWRRVPFILGGTLLKFCGVALMPFALLVLAGDAAAASAPKWIGLVSVTVACLLVGVGAHTVHTAGLALATDLTPKRLQPRVVGLMYVMLLAGIIASAWVFGATLENLTPGQLVRVLQGAAVAVITLNLIASWKQEALAVGNAMDTATPVVTFRESWRQLCRGPQAVRRLIVVGLGSMAFGMAKVLLEPMGGHVVATAKLLALLAFGGLLGFAFASRLLSRGTDPFRLAFGGAAIGLPGCFLVIGAHSLGLPGAFWVGTFLLGFGGALFGHATLTAIMDSAPKGQVGLALGAWGAVQVSAVGIGIALSGAVRDLANLLLGPDRQVFGFIAEAGGYAAVSALEMGMLVATIVVIAPLLRRRLLPRADGASKTFSESSLQSGP
ncbi:MAG: MFS transporter [Pseudomonadota bacterium]